MVHLEWGLTLLVATAMAIPAFAQQASVAQGQRLALQGTPQGVAACIGCHGAQGEGNAAFPRLAGTGQAYLQAQLDAFADGSRKNPVMQPFAQKLTATERTSLAMFYSRLPRPGLTVASATGPDNTGGWLATRGRWVDQLPACAQCHGADGNGVGGQFPPLAGLPVAYIAQQLQAWKTAVRPPGPLGLMPLIASRLSGQDIDAVAGYYATPAASAILSSVPAKTPARHISKATEK